MKNIKHLRSILLFLPFVLPLFIHNPYYIHGIACKIIIYTILVLSLDFVVGYFGDISIGHAGFFAVGAYTVALLTVPRGFNYEASLHNFYQIPFLIALPIGIILAGAFGFFLGFPSLRLKGPYLAIVTIAYGFIIYSFINQEEGLTNGSKGIMLPPLHIFNINFSNNIFFYFLYPCFLLVFYLRHNLMNSFWGRTFEAIKYSEAASAACGISKTYYKIFGMVISASIAGFAGGLFVQLDSYIAPNTFSYSFSVEILIALIVGGVQSLFGNILGASVMVILPDMFNHFNEYRLLVYGLLLLLILYFLPKGLASLISKIMPKKSAHDKEKIKQNILSHAKNSENFIQKFIQLPPTQQMVLEAKNITMKFGGLVAVDDLCLQINSHQIHGLIGPNGSGKSTMVNVLSGIYKPQFGQTILLATNNLIGLEPYKISNKGVVRTFQNLQLFGGLTVLENVMIGLHSSFKSSLPSIISGWHKSKQEEKEMQYTAYQLLCFVGLEDEAHNIANNLSYGQARFLEITRAIATKPKVLMLDEPAAGLTSSEIETMKKIILSVKNLGIAVLLIEHHIEMVMNICDTITVLNFGKKIASGNAKEIQNNPKVIQSYLGNST